MKTPMNELIDRLVNLSNTTYFNGKKSDCDIIDKIKDIVRHEFLEKEKQRVIEAYEKDMDSNGNLSFESGEQYYNETFS